MVPGVARVLAALLAALASPAARAQSVAPPIRLADAAEQGTFTVGAARAVARLRPDVLTVHAVGGPDVIRAAVEAAPGTMVAAVTVLTSLGDDDLGRIGMVGPVPDAVLRLAILSVEAGAQGLVCSPREVSAVRSEVGPDVTLITPGVRPAGAEAHDQARVATPEEAVLAGADLLVIGRPITRAPDPGAAAAAIAASLRRVAVVRDPV